MRVKNRQQKPFHQRNKRGNNNRSHHQKPHQKRTFVAYDQLSETDVGITQYLSKLEGFSGIIKERFSDFQVNEIDLDGNVAKLTDTSVPKDFEVPAIDVESIVVTSPLELISQDDWNALRSLVQSAEAEDCIKLDANEWDKEARTKVHASLKEHFGKKLIVDTVNEEEKKVMVVKKHTNNTQDNRNAWPSDKPEYVHFLVFKECVDTLDATVKISDCVKVATSKFMYAGVKDKRAKTTQWFSVWKVQPWKLIKKTRCLQNIKIGNITLKDAPLHLGELQGNQFRIALRNVQASDEQINEAMNLIKEQGFINYFGLQRFGNDKDVPTFAIGLELLLGNWKKAVELILKVKSSDDPLQETSKAKKVFAESSDATLALKQFSNNRTASGPEHSLLIGLSKGHENDYVNALEKIPRNMRLLYIHSFQSLIWNQMVSQRIEKFGVSPVEGDLVLIGEKLTDLKETEEKEDDEIKCKQEVEVLTEETVKNYTIYDVVLPLPGYDIIYPNHLKESYKTLLESHGLSLEMPKQSVKTYTLSGKYRKIMEKVDGLKWKTLLYNTAQDNLIRSDFEELLKKPEPESKENGKLKALVMEFSLSASSYATMVLREILKRDTGTASQAKLNTSSTASKNVEMTSVTDEIVPENTLEESNSLISDKAKYDAFKNSIFNEILTPKRPLEDDEVVVEEKKVKIE